MEKDDAESVETYGQGAGVWLAWGARESRPVGGRGKADKGPASQSAGWTEARASCHPRSPHAWDRVATSISISVPVLAWLPASQEKRSPSAQMTKKGHLLSRKIGLVSLFST